MDRDPLAGSRITVAVIEDHPVTIQGITTWIRDDPSGRIEIIAAGADLDAVFAAGGRDADVLLLDLELGDTMVTDRIADLCDNGHRVIVFSNHHDNDIINAVLEAGAASFLPKHESGEHCIKTIVEVATDRPYVTPTVAGALLANTNPNRPRLAPQEKTALLLWFQGMPKASVAARMGIQETTVKQYINRARIKFADLGRPAKTKDALLARAIEDGLIRPDEVGQYESRARWQDGEGPARDRRGERA